MHVLTAIKYLLSCIKLSIDLKGAGGLACHFKLFKVLFSKPTKSFWDTLNMSCIWFLLSDWM